MYEDIFYKKMWHPWSHAALKKTKSDSSNWKITANVGDGDCFCVDFDFWASELGESPVAKALTFGEGERKDPKRGGRCRLKM